MFTITAMISILYRRFASEREHCHEYRQSRWPRRIFDSLIRYFQHRHFCLAKVRRLMAADGHIVSAVLPVFDEGGIDYLLALITQILSKCRHFIIIAYIARRH